MRLRVTLRKYPSKRRWKARASAGKWVPLTVVMWLDDVAVVSDNWEPHPTEKGFWRLRRSAEVIS
jgi:hypothetical protein